MAIKLYAVTMGEDLPSQWKHGRYDSYRNTLYAARQLGKRMGEPHRIWQYDPELDHRWSLVEEHGELPEYAALRNRDDGTPIEPLWGTYHTEEIARACGASLVNNYTIWKRVGGGAWEIVEMHQ